MMIRLVVFDLAGTTIKDEGEVPDAFLKTLIQFGVELTATELSSFRGASKKQVIRRFIQDSETAEKAYRQFQEILSQQYKMAGVREIPGAGETFRSLRNAGVSVALNTGFDRMITGQILEQTPWDRTLFNAIVCGDDVPQGRPAPDLILRCMELSGVRESRNVANVGDTVLDLRAGNNARVGYNIAVLSGAHTREQLEREPHTHIISSVRELQSVMGDSPAELFGASTF
jgi:phosphonatase-like hydrolase